MLQASETEQVKQSTHILVQGYILRGAPHLFASNYLLCTVWNCAYLVNFKNTLVSTKDRREGWRVQLPEVPLRAHVYNSYIW